MECFDYISKSLHSFSKTFYMPIEVNSALLSAKPRVCEKSRVTGSKRGSNRHWACANISKWLGYMIMKVPCNNWYACGGINKQQFGDNYM